MLLHYNKKPIKADIHLPGSKSISNRLLILKEVLNLDLKLQNLSTSKDTDDLISAIDQIKKNRSGLIDTGHGGTDMRFLAAFLSVTGGEWKLTGSERMKERPIGELVNALRQIGAEIFYLEKDGFPPLKIKGKKLKGGKIEIDGSISSQFISALLLVSPTFENGLEIKIKGEIVSRPYILMTLDLLSEFGIKASATKNKIIVSAPLLNSEFLLRPAGENMRMRNSLFQIESDWSSASYFYSIAALSKNANITLGSLHKGSLQGDSVLHEIYKNFGVSTKFKDGSVVLSNTKNLTNYFEYDFIGCPDIAQTIAVTCLGLKINCHLKGLSTLKHKETDRLLALKTELEKFGAEVTITGDSLVMQSAVRLSGSKPCEFKLETYKDHRMAMAFAPLALIYDNIGIQDSDVVQKSYPEFWEDLKLTGIYESGSC